MKNATITRNLANHFNQLQDRFRALYTRSDYEYKLRALEEAIGRSDEPTRRAELLAMLEARGIVYDKNKTLSDYAQEFPDFAQIEKEMLEALYESYAEFPTPQKYMERIVNRLCQEEAWKNDTLRLRILKRFIKYGNRLTYYNSANEKVAIYGGESYIRKYLKEKGAKSDQVWDDLSLLEDDVFAALDTATKEQKKPTGKFGLLKMVDDLASGKFRTGGATKKSLYLFALVYNMSFYSGLADMIDHETDIEINLFQDYYNNNLMRFITDAYRGKLDEYERDPSGQGINYKNFAEMVYLYYLSKDISPAEKIKGSHEMITEVCRRCAGKGIPEKPKNTSETQYFRGLMKGVYCEEILTKNEEEFLNFLCEHYQCDTKTANIGEMQMRTEQQSAFNEYKLVYNKLCVALEENAKSDAAFSQILSLVTNPAQDSNLNRCNYGLWFTDMAAFHKQGYKEEYSDPKYSQFIEMLFAASRYLGHITSEENNPNSKEGVATIQRDVTLDGKWVKVPELIPVAVQPSRTENRIPALRIDQPNNVTRSAIIVAFYYYYNARHERDGRNAWRNFAELYDAFKQEIDTHLEAACYQPLSSKNLFDLLVVFSSYAYLNV